MQLFEYLIYKLNVLGADSSVPISENKFNKMNSQEENRLLNSDFVSKTIKICRSISEFKLEIAP